MSHSITIKRDRAVSVDVKLLRKIAATLLHDLLALEEFEIGISIVRAEKMAQVNWKFLQHKGSTDVITFDYSDHVSRLTPRAPLHGELFICYDEAARQSRQFRTNWQIEIVRYLVHGVLHLHGFDDHRAGARRKMKREENRLLRELNRRFPISKLARRASSS